MLDRITIIKSDPFLSVKMSHAHHLKLKSIQIVTFDNVIFTRKFNRKKISGKIFPNIVGIQFRISRT